jgi:hypothetical protein
MLRFTFRDDDSSEMTIRSRPLLLLTVITILGGAFRFYNLLWGAPYHHFHSDEHELFVGADLLYQSAGAAARSGKFFAYGPLPMYILNAARWIYEMAAQPLVLTTFQDATTYMALGRAVSATLATAAIPVIYAVAIRVGGPAAGLFAAAYLALSVLPIRDAHFFTADISMTFFCMLTWLGLLSLAETGTTRSAIATGVAFAAALTCHHRAIFMAAPIALACLVSPAPMDASRSGETRWSSWAARGLILVAATAATFVLLDPLVLPYFDKFLFDLRVATTEPASGALPIAAAHFVDLSHPRLFWFTNLLWWGMGPALEVASLVGVAWLLTRTTVPALLVAAVPIAYFVSAAGSPTPFVRYAIPLVTALTVAAGAWSADLWRHPRRRTASLVATSIVIAATAVYAAAYLSIFRQEDSRVEAAQYLRQLPNGARVLVESSNNTPPIGSYFFATSFYRDYVLRRPNEERNDFLSMYALDVEGFLYDRSRSREEKQAYIASRLVRADWIVIDDSYLERYERLPEADFGVVQQHYRDLFAGRLGFRLERTFAAKPWLFGLEIDDSRSELSFRSYDHPRVFVFRRGG